MENLHAAARDEDIDTFSHQPIGYRIEVPLDRDVIVEVDGCPDRPVADDVGLDRQALECGAFDRFEQVAPAALARRCHRLVVEFAQQQRDRLV